MSRNGSATKERILEAGTSLVLQRGIASASVEQISADAGVTKGSFFHHFRDKEELLDQMVKRFAEHDQQEYWNAVKRLEILGVSDPLQRLLLFVGFFIELFSDIEDPPACLYASFLYEKGLVSGASMETVRASLLFWREKMSALLAAAAEKYPPKLEIDYESLADAFSCVIEGAFIASQIFNDPKVSAEQLTHFRNYLELLFDPMFPRPQKGSGAE